MKLEKIDTSTTDGKVEVMRLSAEGRRVAQALLISRKGRASMVARWEETSFPEWNWAYYLYAIIAEPVGPDEVWVIFGQGHVVAGPFLDKNNAVECCGSYTRLSEVVHYRRADLAGEVKP